MHRMHVAMTMHASLTMHHYVVLLVIQLGQSLTVILTLRSLPSSSGYRSFTHLSDPKAQLWAHDRQGQSIDNDGKLMYT